MRNKEGEGQHEAWAKVSRGRWARAHVHREGYRAWLVGLASPRNRW